MAFEKGNKLGNGRPKGAGNKFTTQFKDLLTETYQALEKKKETGLLVWAQNNPTDFYKICAKLIPLQITGEGGEAIKIQGEWIPPSSQAKSKE
ncbi:MAG: hypothetical protein ACUZ8H_03205 [Candidatus Anammoxibacter sp.]